MVDESWVDEEHARLLRALENERRRPVPPPPVTSTGPENGPLNRSRLADAIGAVDDYGQASVVHLDAQWAKRRRAVS